MPEVDLPSLLGEFLADPDAIEDCSYADLAVRKAIMEGDLKTARRLAVRILGKGYRNAGFMAICKRYPVCGDN